MILKFSGSAKTLEVWLSAELSCFFIFKSVPCCFSGAKLMTVMQVDWCKGKCITVKNCELTASFMLQKKQISFSHESSCVRQISKRLSNVIKQRTIKHIAFIVAVTARQLLSNS